MCVQKDRFPDKNLDCQTPTASDWKTNRKRSPVGTANTLMHQHYNDLQSSSSGLAVWVIFFAKDPPGSDSHQYSSDRNTQFSLVSHLHLVLKNQEPTVVSTANSWWADTHSPPATTTG